jgi:hypothetical protein
MTPTPPFVEVVIAMVVLTTPRNYFIVRYGRFDFRTFLVNYSVAFVSYPIL